MAHYKVFVLTTMFILSVYGHFPDCPEVDTIRFEHPPSSDISPGPHRILGTVGLQRFNNENAITALPQYSSDDKLPWHCEEMRTWRDLGESYFPRYIQQVRCLNSTCLHGHYSCKPVLYTVKVLTNNNRNCRDSSLPPSLRRYWVLANVETATACSCQTW